MPTITHDLSTLAAAIEARDAGGQLAAYAPGATITIVDALHGPSAPLVLGDRDAIDVHLRDVCARDMTHDVVALVSGDGAAAFHVACRYADGTRVLCSALVELDGDGRITRQTIVQAWDS